MLQMNSLGLLAYLIPIWLFFIFLRLQLQWTPDNSNLQGKSKKRFELLGVRVTGSSKKISESKVKFSLQSDYFNLI